MKLLGIISFEVNVCALEKVIFVIKGGIRLNPVDIWESLLIQSLEKPLELTTKKGLNFKLQSNGKILTVHESEKLPSSKLKYPRPIYKENFLNVCPYYERWRGGEKGISKELTALTVNSVYIMAAINHVVKCSPS